MTALQALSKDPPPQHTGLRKSKAVTAAHPPVMTPAPEKPLHPLFGKLDPDFVFNCGSAEMLAHWHRKSVAVIVSMMSEGNTDAHQEKFDAACSLSNDLLNAIKKLNVSYASGIATQMNAVVADLVMNKNDQSIEEVLSVADFKHLAASLTKATAMIQPVKRVGKLARGKKLTRAGLLFRYQCFLIEEIHTLSLEMYGEARYAMQWLTFDEAVHKSLKKKGTRRRCDPFLDPTKLTERANAVLKSLKVDRVHADARHINMGKGRAR